MADWTTPLDPRFVETEYVVDATSNEQHQFWAHWHRHWGFPYEQISQGMWMVIGKCTGRPIAVSVSWDLWAGHRVAFVDGTSELVDYEMIEKWREAVFPCLKLHGRHSDANNFGNVLRDICERDKREYFDRKRYDKIEALLRSAARRG